ncbi:MAG: XdhC family protein [Alphaproteobacteria bacterium]|nr:XdhC family protein [Alphaproteobacteria bacterium]
MKTAQLDALLAARTAKQPVTLVTQLSTGTQALVRDGAVDGALPLDQALEAAVDKAQTDDRSLTIESGGERYFVQVFSPPRRLIAVGAVHIAQTLVPMASLAGYAVTVIDPRGAFATDLRFPGVTLLEEWPDDALKELAPDRRTAVVTLTHDPKLDDPALDVALRSDAFYIGALGSRRTHARRLERLKERGFNERDFARIHGPIGLNIGAVSPAEIAVSILAEITQTLHRPAADKAA